MRGRKREKLKVKRKREEWEQLTLPCTIEEVDKKRNYCFRGWGLLVNVTQILLIYSFPPPLRVKNESYRGCNPCLGREKLLCHEEKVFVSRGNLRPKSWDVCFKPWNVYPKAWDVNFKAWDIKYVGKKKLLSPDINLVTPRHRKTRESNVPFYRSYFEASIGDKINHL